MADSVDSKEEGLGDEWLEMRCTRKATTREGEAGSGMVDKEKA